MSDVTVQVSQLPALVVTIPNRGAQGLPGPQGLPGSATLSIKADVAISGESAVTGSGTYATINGTISEAYVVGISTEAAAQGAQLPVQSSGLLTFGGWTWTPNKPIYLGINGGITQTPPSTGFIVTLGTAISATSIAIDISQPVQLS